MKYIVCSDHVGYALDMIVATTKEAPQLLPLEEEKICSECEKKAEYIVANE